MFKKSPGVLTQKDLRRRVVLYRKLLRHEARIGGRLFGPVPEGHHREFFCLDTNTWVWHEEWHTKDGRLLFVTTRYDLSARGIVKSQNGTYVAISPQEIANLVRAIRLYEKQVELELYPLVG